jgi:hypothetical protein
MLSAGWLRQTRNDAQAFKPPFLDLLSEIGACTKAKRRSGNSEAARFDGLCGRLVCFFSGCLKKLVACDAAIAIDKRDRVGCSTLVGTIDGAYDDIVNVRPRGLAPIGKEVIISDRSEIVVVVPS